MKKLIFLAVYLISLFTAGQETREMYPELGALIDKSSKGEKAFVARKKKCEELLEKADGNLLKLLLPERRFYDNHCDMEYENYWDVIKMGCSWYCGGGLDTLSASSALKSYKEITYSAKNIHDLSYKTAWVEGVSGQGIGETFTFHIPPENPRITEIIVVNGYVKSEKIWRANARVKKLKMYINDRPFAILNLKDTRKEQHFKFKPLGYGDQLSREKLKKQNWWRMKFEILEVYEGDKYEDTAITEIYFDGIDVH